MRDGWSNYVDLRGARAENDTLKQQVAELEVRLQEQRALARRSEQLQALLDLQADVDGADVAAEVIAGYADPGHSDRHDRQGHRRRRAGRTWR